jgi:hypothetical protein
MNRNIKFIKGVYLLGVVIDGLWVIILAIPSLYKIITNNSSLEISVRIYPLFYVAASLMLGWTILLFLGYQKPIERRFILLLTAYPVVLGIFIATLISFLNGSTMALFFVVKTFLILIIYTIAFLQANKIYLSGK